jgi:hypothetical protein
MLKIISRETNVRYNEILKEMNITCDKELENRKVAALYIICAKEYLWANRRVIFDFKDQDIREDVFNLIKGSSNRALVLLALNLFINYKDKETDVLSIVKNVNRQDRDIVIKAINIIWN